MDEFLAAYFICFCIGIITVVISIPILLWLEYKSDCKKYSKETADAIRMRWG